jgi:hypothetical protein
MAKAVFEIVGQSQGLEEVDSKLQALKSREKEILTEMDSLIKRQKEFAGANKVVKRLEDEYKSLEEELKGNRKSIESLSEAQKKMPGKVIAENANKSFRQLRREIEEQIKQMQRLGQTGTEEYQNLIKEAGELADIQGDVSREINSLASDTYAFDTILEGTQLAAGGFAVAQGAMALFGAENEDLQKVMVKLQAAIAITTGLQQVGNAVQAESNLMRGVGTIQTKAAVAAEGLRAASIANTVTAEKAATVAKTAKTIAEKAATSAQLSGNRADLVAIAQRKAQIAAEKQAIAAKAAHTAATGKATIAQAAFNLVAKANPYVLLAMALVTVVGAVWAFVSASKSSERQAENEKRAIDNLKESYSFLEKEINAEADIRKATAKTRVESVKIDIETENERWQKTGAIELAGLRSNQNIGIKLTKQKKERLKELEEEEREHWKKLDDLGIEYRRAQGLDQIDANKKEADETERKNKEKEDAEKQAAEKAKAERERRNAEILKAGQDLDTERIRIMKEGEDKEIATLQNALQKRLSEIKGNSKTEKDLRQQLIDNYEKDEEKIRENYRIKREESELETELTLINARLAVVEKGSEEEMNIRIEAAEKKAEIDKKQVEKSVEDEKLKAAKILEINNKLKTDIDGINAEYIKSADERSKAEVLAATQQYEQGKMSKFEYEKQSRDISIQSLEDEIADRKAAGEDTVALEKELSEKRIAIAEEEKAARLQIFEELSGLLSNIGNALYDGQKQKLDQELSDLEHYYTTDAEAAKKNKDLKLISEEEMARRQLEIKRKQAQAEKNQAYFNATLQLAEGVVRIWSQTGVNPILAGVLTGILVANAAIQIAAISSKPLPKYWKGRKGGKGEWALAGEYGPELMWIPDGASIMPHRDTKKGLTGDMNVFDRWNMPRINPNIPQMPNVSQNIINQYNREHPAGERIDYDRLGRAVAKHMKFPKQKDVSIHFDKSGLSIAEGNTTTHFLNSKYTR